MYYFIVNEHGGGGRAKRVCARVKKIMESKGKEFSFYCTQKDYSATQIAHSLTENSLVTKDIVVIGGDGTLNEVLCGIQDFSKVRLALIPTGSGNDFSRGLASIGHKISKKTKKAVENLLSAKDGTFIDLGCVENNSTGQKHFFGISAGIGLDALVCQKVDSSFLKSLLNRFKLGKFVYAILTVVSLFTMKHLDVTVKFDTEDKEVTYNNLIFLAAMNMRTEGGGIPMAPNATPTDGKLSVCIAYGYSKIKSFITFASLIKGKHTNLKGFYIKDVNSILVNVKENVFLHTDGECCTKVNSIKINCLPHKLCILV